MSETGSLVGMHVGSRYTVLNELGSGGMARVFRVQDSTSNTEWALKVLRAELSHDLACQRRFKTEHRVLASLSHPNIPAVHDMHTTPEGLPCFAMELVNGNQLPSGEPWHLDDLFTLLADLMPVLSYLHRQGLVHGDLKAENLMRTVDGHLKVMDFGICGPVGSPRLGVQGTLTHLAPELIQRGKADQRADLYAVGVILYQLTTGRLPLLGKSAAETLKLHLEASPVVPRNLRPEIPAELDALIARLLSKRPQDRPQSANEVLRLAGLPAEPDDTLAVPLQSTFIGRKEALGTLLAAAGEAAQGHRPKTFTIVGAPGVGKSRLLEELMSQAPLLDLVAVSGSCASEQTPLGPWLDLARELLAVGRPLAPEASDLLQEALRPFLEPTANLTTDPGGALRRAFERLLEAVCSQRGLLILLDDWHLADAASAALLSHLIDPTARRPIAWIIAAQEVTGPDAHTIFLQPLSPSETGELLSSSLGTHDLPEAVSEQIFATTQGSPRFVLDLLRYLLASKQLVKQQGGWRVVASEGASLPKGLAALYEARTADMPSSSMRLARVLAVHGGTLPPDMLTLASGLPLTEAEIALTILLARQDVRQWEPGVTLVDQQMAAWLLDGLTDTEKQEIHNALADALSTTPRAHAALRLLNGVAHHGQRGGQPEKFLPWILTAARRNLSVSAFRESQEFAEAALGQQALLTPHELQEMYETLATSHRSLGHGESARQVAEDAVRLAESLGDATLLARALNGLGKIEHLASRFEQAKISFERASEAASDEAPYERARAYRALGRLATVSGDLEMAYQYGVQAMQWVRQHAPLPEQARFMAEIGETFQGSEERLREGLALLEEAAQIAADLHDNALKSFVAGALGNLRLSLGQLVDAKASFAHAVELHEITGNTGEQVFNRLNLALVAEEQGYFEEAEQLASSVTQEARRMNRRFPMAAAMAIEGSAAAHMGRTREGLARLAEAMDIAETINHKMLQALIRQMEAPLQILLGDFERAHELAQNLIAFGISAGVPEFEQRGRLCQAEIALERGQNEAARESLAPIIEGSNLSLRLRAHRLLSDMAWREGDIARARMACEVAQTLNAQVDAPRDHGPLLMLEARINEGEAAFGAATQAVKILESTQQRHSLPLALYVAAQRGRPEDRAAALARARELLQAMAGTLGESNACYIAAFDRQKIITESILLPQNTPLPEDLETPTTIAGLQSLAARLLKGIEGLSAQEGQQPAAVWGLDRAGRRLEQVVSFARTVNSSLQLETVIDRALALIIEITGAERGLLLLKEGPTVTTHRFATAPGFDIQDAEAEQYSRTVARTVLETGETVCVLDALSDPRFAQQASVLGLNLQTIIAVPLSNQGEIIGAIYVDRQGLSEHFTQGDLEIVQVLAGMTSVALTNARLMKQQMDNVLQLDQLNKLSRSVSRTLELEKVLEIISQVTLEIVKAERCLIFLWENEQLVFGSGRDHDGPLTAQAGRERSGTICQKVVDTLQPVHVIDARQDAELANKKSVLNLRIASVVAVPLLADAGLTGVLYIDSRTRVSTALEKEVAVLQAIANTAALAVQNARHYREATVDHLTGLYVRSLFLRRIDEEVRRTRRFGGKFSLLVLDIDHFKRFNDAHGHQTGDAVLRMVARTIREAVRVGLDVPCRYGGEEMVILLPETDAPGAVVTAERIRKQIETASLPAADGTPLSVTVSIGVASFPLMAASSTELFENADKALYASKNEGRNRVSVYAAQATAL
ncbi:MAG: diguanylate cyclase [Candidatus Sericytochromatia bacterium]|nr:diguanylate cyclase [Candidatus Sericytochromatia bacterium]